MSCVCGHLADMHQDYPFPPSCLKCDCKAYTELTHENPSTEMSDTISTGKMEFVTWLCWSCGSPMVAVLDKKTRHVTCDKCDRPSQFKYIEDSNTYLYTIHAVLAFGKV